MLLAGSCLLAYIDLGTGSYVFQLLVGAFLGGLLALKLFWRRVWSFLSGLLGGGGSRKAPRPPEADR